VSGVGLRRGAGLAAGPFPQTARPNPADAVEEQLPVLVFDRQLTLAAPSPD
jgi:hypothetical protein